MSNDKMKLLLPSTMARAGWEVAEARDNVETAEFDVNMPTAEFHALLGDVHGVALGVTPFAQAELQAARNLRVVARIGVGYDAVDVALLTKHSIPLMVTGTANSPSVAEQALFFMLALAKRGEKYDVMVREGRWAERFNEFPVDLFGKTVLVVGFGRIGSRISSACLALGMTVRVYDPYVAAADMAAAGCARVEELDAVLGEVDFVTIHCPKNSETIGMFNANRLARMKSSAYLINTARGGIIDEAALHSALTDGTIAGAGLDVFDQEPPQPDNPLLKLPNVITAPHMAGITIEAFERMAVATVQNMLDVLDGKPNMDHVVNKEVFA
ncbi:MAG: hydroxyacid dehydrogenase [Betaproteobacteria bacterium]|nr:MAG: hydroxyacid dehydrogenase [Betaproteobacteria bacterium]